jgi:hypothetical protein
MRIETPESLVSSLSTVAADWLVSNRAMILIVRLADLFASPLGPSDACVCKPPQVTHGIKTNVKI